MAFHNELGKKGEQIALDFLMKDGYTILTTNYRYQRGEIDIVVRDKNHRLRFVEVKTRRHSDTPEVAVHNKKMELLIETAIAFKHQYELEEESFLDIISIHFLNENSFEIVHFEDVWI